MKKHRYGRGFTLIELMIAIGIVGVLAGISLPVFIDMLEKAKEGATRGNISAIMGAVRIYNADTMGEVPEDLNAAEFKKYLGRVPAVKVTCPHGAVRLSGDNNEVEVLTLAPGDELPEFKAESEGWRYDNQSGGVWVNNSQQDTKDFYYSHYGYF